MRSVEIVLWSKMRIFDIISTRWWCINAIWHRTYCSFVVLSTFTIVCEFSWLNTVNILTIIILFVIYVRMSFHNFPRIVKGNRDRLSRNKPTWTAIRHIMLFTYWQLSDVCICHLDLFKFKMLRRTSFLYVTSTVFDMCALHVNFLFLCSSIKYSQVT